MNTHGALEGLTVQEIADLFGVNDRTIRRDKAKIRKSNALRPSGDIEAELLGEYHVHVELAVSRLNRLFRDPAASVADKITAIKSASAIWDQFVDRLNSIGWIGNQRDDPVEQVNLAELIQVCGVISSEFTEDSSLTKELKALIARMHTGQDQPRIEDLE